MKIKYWNHLGVISLLLLSTEVHYSYAQVDTTPKKKLLPPVVERSGIGGASHDSYRVYLRKGSILKVQLFWKHVDNNKAEFTVSRSNDFFKGGAVNFGQVTENGTLWTGKIPSTGNYYIYVVGHPTVDYALKVTTR